MSIKYPADWLINGGPPMDGLADYPGDIINDDEGSIGPVVCFYQDEWYIIDLKITQGPPSVEDGVDGIQTSAKVLASFPANQYYKVAGYMTNYAEKMYNWHCEVNRPNQDATLEEQIDASMDRHPAGKKRPTE